MFGENRVPLGTLFGDFCTADEMQSALVPPGLLERRDWGQVHMIWKPTANSIVIPTAVVKVAVGNEIVALVHLRRRTLRRTSSSRHEAGR